MKKLGDETVIVNVRMPLELREAIDRKQVEEGHASRSEAARVAIESGLNGHAPKKKRSPRSSGACPHPSARRIGKGCAQCGEADVW